MRALRRLALVAVVAAAAGGAFVYLQRTEPPWWARLWFPLRYTAIVRGHSAHYRLNPALLAAAGANDFLQAGFAALTQKSNELEQRAGG